jgi:23S rRNA (pseudouridine1915-N3)-methyltransferase
MIKIKILTTNKTKEKWLEEAIDEYIKRLKTFLVITFIFAKDTDQLALIANKEDYIIALSPEGQTFTSEAFSVFLTDHIVASGSRISFVIGGPTGLPANLKPVKAMISLSQLTFTHQVARLILVEQIYRAIEISKGTPYHK